MKKRNDALLALVFLLPMVALAAISMPVSAQTSPCTATIGNPITSGQRYYPSFMTGYMNYYAANLKMTVPVSVSCAGLNGQLSSGGRLYDTATHGYVGSATTILTQVNSSYYTGQLVFYLEPAVQGHTMVLTVSTYNYGTIMGTGLMMINPRPYQGVYYDCTNPGKYKNSNMYWYYYTQCA